MDNNGEPREDSKKDEALGKIVGNECCFLGGCSPPTCRGLVKRR